MLKRYAWIPVWAIIIASIIISFEYGKVPPSQPSMIEVLGLSYTMQGLLMTAFSVAAIIMGLVGGTLIDRFGARKIVSIALVISVIGNIISLFWTTDAGLLTARVMEGFGYGAVMTGGPVIISAWYEPAKRGLAYGVWGANVGVGMLICTGVADPILGTTDWTGMWIFALVGAVLALVMVAICVGMPADEDRKDAFLDNGEIAKDDTKHGLLWGYLAPLPILAAIIFFLIGGATDAFNAFTITYLNVFQGYDFGEATTCALIASVGFLVGAVIMGFVFAKVKDKGMVLVVNVALAIICLFAWFNLDLPLYAMYAIALIIGIILGAGPTAFFAVAPMTARSAGTVGAATAIIVLGQNVGTLIVPTVIGMVLDASGYSMAATVMGGLGVVALLISFVWRSLYRKRSAVAGE